MMVEDLHPSMKIIVLGNGKVGKTTLTIKFSKNEYTSEYKKTLGVDFLTAQRYIKTINKEVDFHIWDTAGQDVYNAITRRYYKGADGALIVFSINDKESFENVKSWYDKIKNECDYDIPIIIVMSKIDLIDERAVSDIDAINLAKSLNVELIKVSSKNGVMVNEVFEKLAIKHFSIYGESYGQESVENVSKNKLTVKNPNINNPNKEEEINNKSNNEEIKEIQTCPNSKRSNKENGFKLDENEKNAKASQKKKRCCK